MGQGKCQCTDSIAAAGRAKAMSVGSPQRHNEGANTEPQQQPSLKLWGTVCRRGLCCTASWFCLWKALTPAETGRLVRLTCPACEDSLSHGAYWLPPQSPRFLNSVGFPNRFPSPPRLGTSDWASILLISIMYGLMLCSAPSGLCLWISEMHFCSPIAWVLHIKTFAFHSYFSELGFKSSIWKAKNQSFSFIIIQSFSK